MDIYIGFLCFGVGLICGMVFMMAVLKILIWKEEFERPKRYWATD